MEWNAKGADVLKLEGGHGGSTKQSTDVPEAAVRERLGDRGGEHWRTERTMGMWSNSVDSSGQVVERTGSPDKL